MQTIPHTPTHTHTPTPTSIHTHTPTHPYTHPVAAYPRTNWNWAILLTLLCSLTALLLPAPLRSQSVPRIPPPGAPIPAEDRTQLQTGVDQLEKTIEDLRTDLKGKSALLALLPDVQIFYNAVHYALAYDEIFNPGSELPAARNLLKEGMDRAEELRMGKPSWISARGLVVRGYLSKVDGSIQPYGLVIPPTFSPDTAHRFRLDVWFHGRDERLSELNFLNQRERSPGEFTPPNTIVLHPYGRYCNGQRFAGETDLFEALAEVKKNYPIDESRILVRGFSLGGGSCWHIATHHAGLWAAAAPGAGFSETAGFLNIASDPVQPPWYQQRLWHLYDSTDYAANLFNCPTVAYSGEIDHQKQAADMMAKALAAEGMELVHIIGPHTAHQYHPQAKLEISRRIDSIAAAGRNPLPRKVRFTTWTLRYNQMLWITVDALDRHWEQARVDGEITDDHTVRLQTRNVQGLTLSMPSGLCPLDNSRKPDIILDGGKIESPPPASDRSWSVSFWRDGRHWRLKTVQDDTTLLKRHALQGPIDDAFMDSFLMVRPTGKPLNDRTGAWTAAEMAHAITHWRLQFRGEAPVKDDTQVTDAEIADHNLVLWGDPSSNAILARIADRLPIHWDAQSVRVGQHAYPSDHHVPVLIFPNPLNPTRYVVLNSGFTFREYDYLNNARQTPKLPDYAVIDISVPPSPQAPGGIVDAGFFGEHWELLPNEGRPSS